MRKELLKLKWNGTQSLRPLHRHQPISPIAPQYSRSQMLCRSFVPPRCLLPARPWTSPCSGVRTGAEEGEGRTRTRRRWSQGSGGGTGCSVASCSVPATHHGSSQPTSTSTGDQYIGDLFIQCSRIMIFCYPAATNDRLYICTTSFCTTSIQWCC